MNAILQFPADRTRPPGETFLPVSAGIIIFPGVRIERHEPFVPVTLAKLKSTRKTPTQKRRP